MAFVAVADTLHFGRAAERLGIAQPAISQLIRRLEDQLGLILFERTSHRVTITPAGQTLLPDARSVVATVQRLGDRASQLAEGSAATLRVATTTGIGAPLADLLSRYRQARPTVALDLQVLTTTQKLAGIATATIDLAFLRSTPPPTPGLAMRIAWSEPYVAVLPAEHAPASGQPLDVHALVSLPLLLVAHAEHPAMHAELLDVCRSLGFEPQTRPRPAAAQDTLALVAAGTAWTLFIDGNVPPLAGVRACPLPEGTPPSRVWLVWRDIGATTHVLDFVEIATA